VIAVEGLLDGKLDGIGAYYTMWGAKGDLRDWA